MLTAKVVDLPVEILFGQVSKPAEVQSGNDNTNGEATHSEAKGVRCLASTLMCMLGCFLWTCLSVAPSIEPEAPSGMAAMYRRLCASSGTEGNTKYMKYVKLTQGWLKGRTPDLIPPVRAPYW